MIDPIKYLRDYLGDISRGLERFCGRYYGMYPGRVIDNRDPQNRGRVRATCAAINMPREEDVPASFWMLPCMNGMGTTPDGQTTGMFHPPSEGTNIWVQFQFGDPQTPVYMGGYVTTKQTAETFKSDDMREKGPSKRGIRTPSGHYILFNDDPDNLEISIVKGDGAGEPTAQFLTMTKEGHTMLTNKNGSALYMNGEDNETTLQTLDDQGNVRSMLMLGDDKITLITKSGGAISINGKDIVFTGNNVVADASQQFSANAGAVMLGKGAAEPVMRGNKMMLWLSTIHQHTGGPPGSVTAPGPNPPPILYKELSENVYIS